jgi:hypothetical protein
MTTDNDRSRLHDFKRRAESLSDGIEALQRDMAVFNEHTGRYEHDETWYSWYSRCLAKMLMIASATNDIRTFLRKVVTHYDTTNSSKKR